MNWCLPLFEAPKELDAGEASAAIIVQRLVTILALSGLALISGGWVYAPVAWVGLGIVEGVYVVGFHS